MFNLRRDLRPFSKTAILLHSHLCCMKVSLFHNLAVCECSGSSHLRYHLLSVILTVAILRGVKWYFVVASIFIYLIMTNDIEHFFMSLLTICISFLNKCLFRFFARLKIGVFLFLLSCKHSLDVNLISDI